MQTVLTIIQLISALLLIVTIMLQEKGAGLGEGIGGQSASSSFETSKRGAEKFLGQATIVLVLVFLGLSLVLNFI